MLNLTSRRIQLLAAEGIIPRAAERGRYDLVAAVSAYCRYLQEIAAGKGDSAKRDAETSLAIERAKKVQRENEQAAGELIPKAEIVALVQTLFGHCRARLLGIPTKVAPVAFMAESVAEVKEKLTEAINDALNELSETRVVAVSENERDRNGRGASGDRNADDVESAAGPKRKRVGRSISGAKSGKRKRTG